MRIYYEMTVDLNAEQNTCNNNARLALIVTVNTWTIIITSLINKLASISQYVNRAHVIEVNCQVNYW